MVDWQGTPVVMRGVAVLLLRCVVCFCLCDNILFALMFSCGRIHALASVATVVSK